MIFGAFLLGGILGLTGSFIPHYWERRRAKASAAALTRAYISGILEMETIRNHSALYEQNLAALRTGATTSVMKIYGSEDIIDEMQKIIMPQIGLLEPDIARDVVMFGNMLEGVRIDLRAMSRGEMDSLDTRTKIDILEKDLTLWREAQRKGKELINRLS
jgi:hypothetical protein